MAVPLSFPLGPVHRAHFGIAPTTTRGFPSPRLRQATGRPDLRQTRLVRALGVEVQPKLMCRWRHWLAPHVQPFFVAAESSVTPPTLPPVPLTPELRDTYKVWRLDRSLKICWLDESAFSALPPSDRAMLVRSQVRIGRGAVPAVRAWIDLVDSTVRQQADGHRFVWWPSLLNGNAEKVLRRIVEGEGLPSRHREVGRQSWARCADLLPGASRLAGSFPMASGANCFGTVMAAAGVAGTADEWILQEHFLVWLAAACRPGGRDHEPGTVLVWRDEQGLPVHAAVTLGDGWALEKPSQAWSSARTVLTVRDVIRANRSPGQRLERHHIRRNA